MDNLIFMSPAVVTQMYLLLRRTLALHIFIEQAKKTTIRCAVLLLKLMEE
jgi:hypothetical protein